MVELVKNRHTNTPVGSAATCQEDVLLRHRLLLPEMHAPDAAAVHAVAAVQAQHFRVQRGDGGEEVDIAAESSSNGDGET